MSQAVAEVQVRELKMNDPKLMKVFDKLKPRDTVKIKHSSTLERGCLLYTSDAADDP